MPTGPLAKQGVGRTRHRVGGRTRHALHAMRYSSCPAPSPVSPCTTPPPGPAPCATQAPLAGNPPHTERIACRLAECRAPRAACRSVEATRHALLSAPYLATLRPLIPLGARAVLRAQDAAGRRDGQRRAETGRDGRCIIARAPRHARAPRTCTAHVHRACARVVSSVPRKSTPQLTARRMGLRSSPPSPSSSWSAAPTHRTQHIGTTTATATMSPPYCTMHTTRPESRLSSDAVSFNTHSGSPRKTLSAPSGPLLHPLLLQPAAPIAGLLPCTPRQQT